MITVLVDHNVEWQAAMLWDVLRTEGWLELLPLRLVTLAQVGLPSTSLDRAVWHHVQEHQMLLLTANRHRDDEDSLESVIQEANTEHSLPVLTIGSVRRIGDRTYRERCARRLFEIAMDLDNYRGTGRIFIP